MTAPEEYFEYLRGAVASVGCIGDIGCIQAFADISMARLLMLVAESAIS